jgi:hypothetical protein
MHMAHGSISPGAVRRLVDAEWSAGGPSADPDDPQVRGFAEFGLPPDSPLATEDWLHRLQAWRDRLQIPANSVFLDGTLLMTVEALLDCDGPAVLTPVTLWELTAFIDALVCYDRLYCVANPAIDVSRFNQRLGAEVLRAIPDPDFGMLRRVAGQAAADGVSNMSRLRARAGSDDAWGQEVQAVVDGWRAVLGVDFPDDGPFDISGVDTRLIQLAAGGVYGPVGSPGPAKARLAARLARELQISKATGEPVEVGPLSSVSALLADGLLAKDSADSVIYQPLQTLIEATRLAQSPGASADRPPLTARQQLAASATYRTYVNQGVANALALPYLPGTLRMPFRRLFVRRAGEVQDELVSVAVADKIFAQQQPSSPLILPFFTAAVLQQATTREDIWAQMAQVRDQSAAFRRVRADLDRALERSQVSAEALRFQGAMHDEALKLADLAGAAQQSASVALGVVAQTGIVPLAGALKVGVDAAKGVGRGGSWTRIWRRLFNRHEYFLAQTNTQAAALTNALPQLQQLWQMPKIGGYLNQFADATQRMGHVLRG